MRIYFLEVVSFAWAEIKQTNTSQIIYRTFPNTKLSLLFILPFLFQIIDCIFISFNELHSVRYRVCHDRLFGNQHNYSRLLLSESYEKCRTTGMKYYIMQMLSFQITICFFIDKKKPTFMQSWPFDKNFSD
ncbi:MAG: hypothetical protein H6Q19_1562 [Bacteroidetes bacterium]|nr:hypothetical protein [Bacteroidota bacterium]